MLFIVNLFLILRTTESVAVKDTTDSLSAGKQENITEVDKWICPKQPLKVPFFGFNCKMDEDCVIPGEVCCQEKKWKICRRGIRSRDFSKLDFRKKGSNSVFQSRLQRTCPSRGGFFETLPIQNCTHDNDCGLWRICCPDGSFNYCRKVMPQLGLIFSSEVVKTFSSVISYLQCTPPPPPPLDFFAKPCKNVLDCFPNLCCQERGKKVCRPSRRSIFPLLTESKTTQYPHNLNSAALHSN